MSVVYRIKKLREKMTEVGISVVLIPTSDCHDSEYVSGYFKCREYFSGFTGSAGTLVVSLDEAFLFTDGRYFIQAEEELSGSGIKLMRAGEAGVPGIREHIVSLLNDGDMLGFDGRMVGTDIALKIYEDIKDKNIKINYAFDPADGIWEDRPMIKSHALFSLPERISGEDTVSKLTRIRKEMSDKGTDTMLVTTLDDIAWILNLRGDDIDYCPLFYAYMVITMDEAHLYTDAITSGEDGYTIDRSFEDRRDLSGVILHDLSSFYDEGISFINERTKKALYAHIKRMNFFIYKNLRDDLKIYKKPLPTAKMKAVKNSTEIASLKNAHIKDAVAMLRFGMWLDDKIKNKDLSGLTELSVSDKLYAIRSAGEDFLESSFETISAYSYHGAIVHYSPDKKTDIPIEEGSFLLIDSGGHYMQGTTDITRTYAIGKIPVELKRDYTLVLRAMLKLLNLRFLKGARGANLDMAVRQLFWEKGLDFKHGTGHGVGFLLNVHEGPNSIRWKIDPSNIADDIFEEGMVTSDEPGLYIEGNYGIRIENEILCRELYKNEYGTFMGFENLTYVPIDLNAVDKDSMTDEDIKNLNEYHKGVYETLYPHLNDEERAYLKKATQSI